MKQLLIPILVILVLGSCGVTKNTSSYNSSPKDDFHLYLLMGQSNMAGRGKVASIDTITHPRVFMLDKNMEWVLAKDPVHFDKQIAGTGLGLTFGKIMANENNNIRIGLIPCAKGGSSINQWFRDSLHYSTKSYPYNEMVSKAREAMKVGTLKGILWHQGESDTKSIESIQNYDQKFYAMMDSVKSDLDTSTVPVVIGELGHFYQIKNPLTNQMNQALEKIANENDHIELVSADVLTHKGDTVHFNSDSYHSLGKRYAEKMILLQTKK